MKMTALKPIYLNRDVVLAGQQFDTGDQHARELIQKGYAEAAPVPPTADATTDGTATTQTAPDASTQALAPAADAPADAPAPAADVQADATAKAKAK
ncbi:hypothetical protein ABK905_09380 [Acerihabitans sp. KWT182]|uniref:DUF7210 domain-containing protein n=1 Tax=Acerihabitans sp. KWT182 TaxID=3157919 RepID=A0AAU7QDJ0_9GAMM